MCLTNDSGGVGGGLFLVLVLISVNIHICAVFICIFAVF